MDVHELLKELPNLMLFFVPGFICLRIKEIYGFKRVHSKFTATIYSFLFSFIVYIIFSGCLYYCKQNHPEWVDFFSKELRPIIKPAIFILLGVILGIVFTWIPRGRLGRLYGKFVNRQYSPEETPWEAATALPHGGKFVVYLKNGMKYEGYAHHTTSDPGEEKKEILLHSYYAYEKDLNNTWVKIKENYRRTTDPSEYEMVLIKYEEVNAVEICPITKDEYKDYRLGNWHQTFLYKLGRKCIMDKWEKTRLSKWCQRRLNNWRNNSLAKWVKTVREYKR